MALHPLNGLYYPYSRPLSIASLKKSVLLFDSIGVIDSQPPAIRDAITREKIDTVTSEVAEEINSACSYLASNGALEVIDPTEVIKKYGQTLTEAVKQDIDDEEFCSYSVSSNFQIWTMLRERLPPDFLKHFYAGAGTFSEALSLQAIVYTNGTMDGIPDRIRQFNAFRHPNVDPATAWAHFLRRYRFVIGGNPHIELPAYQIPFPQASSLRINEALLIANSSEWVPFTDSSSHHRMLEIKINRGRKASAKGRDAAQVKAQIAGAAQLSVGILDAFINESDFDKLSFEDLIRYRVKNEDALKKFRSSVLSLSQDLSQNDASSPSYHTTAAQLALAEVRQSALKVRQNWVEFLRTSSIRVGLASGPAAILAAFGDIGFKGVLMAAGTASALALSSKGSDDLIKLLEANKSAKSHNFCYLTNLSTTGK